MAIIPPIRKKGAKSCINNFRLLLMNEFGFRTYKSLDQTTSKVT